MLFGVGFGVGAGVAEGFGVGLTVGFGVGLTVGVGVGVTAGVGVGVGVGSGTGVGVGAGVGAGVGVGVGVGAGVPPDGCGAGLVTTKVTCSGVIAAEVADGIEIPTPFTASIVNVYGVPFVRPLTVPGDEETVTVSPVSTTVTT